MIPARSIAAMRDRVIVVQGDSLLSDLGETAAVRNATHAAVLRGGAFLGLVRLGDANLSASRQTFAELVEPCPAQVVDEQTPLIEVMRRLVATGSHALPVVGADGTFRGIVTPHGILAEILTGRATDSGFPGSAIPRRHAGEQPAGQSAAIDDIRRANRILQAEFSERVKAEAALRRSEMLLRSVFDNVPAFIMRLNLDGTIAFVNRTVPGLSRADVLGRPVAEFVSPDRRSEAERLLAAAVATGQAQSGEIPGIGADGALALYSFCVAPMREGDEIVGLISVATDITEMKRAQENARELQMELAHVARLSTMGEMASGMAHELNQPLAAIIAYADACQELVESGRIDQNQLRDVLQAVASQADRAGKIIQRLRNLVKKSRPVRAAIQVNEAVREVAALVEAETREAGVRLKLNLEERLPAASADFVQIQQVLLNLMRNGLDAMVGADAGRRELDVSTRRNSDGQLEVAICDCGRGVACDDISRLFEPFFTTKAEGLGMGLPISRTIVEAHGGRLWLTPNPDVGMTAKFVLPGIDGRVPHVNETNGLHRR